MDIARFEKLFSLLDEKTEANEHTVLAIDGGAASGKTTLSEYLSEKYGASVVHMDDFFLPHERKTKARLREIDGNIDRERFSAEVLPMLRTGKPFSYGRYDCKKGMITEIISVRASRLLIVEGVYSLSEHFADAYDIKIMLTVREEEQLARLRARSTPYIFEKFQNIWLPLEKRFFELGNVSGRCDMVF